MKTTINIIFAIFLFSSCAKNNDKEIKLVKVTFSPSFHTPAEILINNTEHYLVFKNIRPSTFPTKIKEDFVNNPEYQKELAIVDNFYSNIENSDFESLDRIVHSFKEIDFQDAKFPNDDGMSTNILIVYNNGQIKVINPMNNPNEQQIKLLKSVIKIASEKNNSKNNQIVLNSIQKYL